MRESHINILSEYTGWPKKGSHTQESSLNCNLIRQLG